jgi:hypothetical protein
MLASTASTAALLDPGLAHCNPRDVGAARVRWHAFEENDAGDGSRGRMRAMQSPGCEGMAAEGARGKTAAEMYTVLHHPAEETTRHAGLMASKR